MYKNILFIYLLIGPLVGLAQSDNSNYKNINKINIVYSDIFGGQPIPRLHVDTVSSETINRFPSYGIKDNNKFNLVKKILTELSPFVTYKNADFDCFRKIRFVGEIKYSTEADLVSVILRSDNHNAACGITTDFFCANFFKQKLTSVHRLGGYLNILDHSEVISFASLWRGSSSYIITNKKYLDGELYGMDSYKFMVDSLGRINKVTSY